MMYLTNIMATQPKQLVDYCIECCSYVLGLGICSLVVVFYVYGIIALCDTSYKEVSTMCSDSNLWYFLLILLILNLSSSKSLVSKASKESNGCGSVIAFLIYMGYISWGTYELFGISCVDQLHDTLLWKMSLISVIINWSIMGLGCIGLCIFTTLSITSSDDSVTDNQVIDTI